MIAFLQFFLALLFSQQPTRAPFDPGGALVALAAFGGGAAITGWFLRGIVAGLPEAKDRLAWISLMGNVGRVAALACFWLLVQQHGISRLPDALGVAGWPVLPWLLAISPFFLLSGIVRASLHATAVLAHAALPSLPRSLVLDAKLALFPLAPVLLFGVFADVAARVDRTTWWGRAWNAVGDIPSLRTFVTLAIVVSVMLVVPSVLRRMWRCRPLPPGPIRDRLEAYAARVGFRARGLLVWPTGGSQMNAAVVGIAPRFRYVFLTDALLDTLSPDEIEAVFAHEAGHAKRGHLVLFLGYTAVLALAAFLPGVVLGPLEALVEPLPVEFRAALVLVLWLGLVFGWVSRRFEQEADVYGIETLSALRGADGTPPPPEAHPFALALERIAAESDGIREVTGWRHFSIAERVDFVRRYLTDESVRRTYRRNILLLRGTLLAAVLVTGGLAVARIPFDLRESHSRRKLDDLAAALRAADPAERSAHLARAAEAARLAGRREEALRWLGEAVSGPHSAECLRDYALLLEECGRPLGARAAWSALAAREDASASVRSHAREHAAGRSEDTPGAR
ncbi:MAG: M48 family metalloprotease [Planctomycetes bacterium]|nr:M48 family metalloprotease [Planctomycetota bacterium]